MEIVCGCVSDPTERHPYLVSYTDNPYLSHSSASPVRFWLINNPVSKASNKRNQTDVAPKPSPYYPADLTAALAVDVTRRFRFLR